MIPQYPACHDADGIGELANAPIIGGFNALEDKQSANETTINLMTETYGGKTLKRLRSTPGLRKFATLPEGPIRGSKQASKRGFFAAGSNLYELLADGTYAVRGFIGNNGNPISLDTNGFQLILVDGERGWGLQLDSNEFKPIISDNFYPTRTITVVGGYAIGVRIDTQQFFHSDLYDVFTWIFSDFASAEVNPDRLQVVVNDSTGAVMLGDESLEIFNQTSDPVQVFQRRSGYATNYGCIAPYSAISTKNGVVWVGQDDDGAGIVYRLAGGLPSIVSTTAITEKLQSYGSDLEKATAFTYQQSQHTFWVLNIPNADTTFVLDLTENEWHERRSFTPNYSEWGRYLAENHVFLFGKNLVGNYLTGDIYELDISYSKDDNLNVRRERTMRPIFDEEGDRYAAFSVFGLDCIVGEGNTNNPDEDPQVSLATSDDNGINFGYERFKSLGLRGKRNQQIRWKRCGFSRSRVFRVSTMSAVPFAINRAWLE